MFMTVNGAHFNMAYFSAFWWSDGEFRVLNDAGKLNCFSDPDRTLYLTACEKAGLTPQPEKEDL